MPPDITAPASPTALPSAAAKGAAPAACPGEPPLTACLSLACPKASLAKAERSMESVGLGAAAPAELLPSTLVLQRVPACDSHPVVSTATAAVLLPLLPARPLLLGASGPMLRPPAVLPDLLAVAVPATSCCGAVAMPGVLAMGACRPTVCPGCCCCCLALAAPAAAAAEAGGSLPLLGDRRPKTPSSMDSRSCWNVCRIKVTAA
jgi:hypothetical protein